MKARNQKAALPKGWAALPAVVALALSVASPASAQTAAPTAWYVLDDPYNQDQLTELFFGGRSHWLQPWRSALTTQPATVLRDIVGINFNVYADAQMEYAAELLQNSGFKHARVEVGWDSIDYDDPSQIDPSRVDYLTHIFTALRDHGLRPLILLNANSGGPGPARELYLTLTAPADAGATTIELDPASAAQVIADYTGIDNEYLPNQYPIKAGVFIESVDGAGNATLSRPLPVALPAGQVLASNMRYHPFAPPFLADGVTPNPRFEETLDGWLAYVRAVCNFVESIFGNDDFDVEIWNELTFGSEFLSESNYYDPLPDPGTTGTPYFPIADATAAMLADPANGLTDVRAGDGFDNQWPWGSPATEPGNMAAIDHHPYEGMIHFPAQATINLLQPLDAQGNPSFTLDSNGDYLDTFIPSYIAFFPEYYLTAIQTETLMRDLSPLVLPIDCSADLPSPGASCIYTVPHGAKVPNPGGHLMANWITEVNMDNPTAIAAGLTGASLDEFRAKAALRYYVSFAGEGTQAIDMYAATNTGGCCDLISPDFFSALDANPGVYPGDAAGGPVMQAVGRLTSLVAGAQPTATPRQLTLTQIASQTNDIQFAGNGTAAFPDLTNRDALAFFPFQTSANHFVAGVYVMTRDMTHLYTETPAPGQTPYDLPDEQFRLTIGQLSGHHAAVALTDPLTGGCLPATIVSRTSTSIVVQLPVSDSPRMLSIDDAPSGHAQFAPGSCGP